jgi:glutathione S-transferase
MPDLFALSILFDSKTYHRPLRLTIILIILHSGILGKEIDQKKITKETKSLLTTVDYYEQLLSKQKYIAGDVCKSLLPVDFGI